MSGIRASQIAEFLGTPLVGADVEVRAPRPLSRPEPGALVFAKRVDGDTAARLDAVPDVFVIAGEDGGGRLRCTHVRSANPRLDFARVLTEFFAQPRREPAIAPTASVAPGAVLGANVRIGHCSVVYDGAVIGDNTELRDFVVVRPGVRIGRDCLIKSHTVLGEEGFGFDFAEDGTPVRVPHHGGVRIGDRVELGSLNTVPRGTLDDTVIGDDVKTDDHVHLAHNVTVGPRTIITAAAEVSGSVQIGSDVWIGPGSSIINKAVIGDRAFLGLGTVVTKDVPGGMVVAGSPARVLRPR